jgi:hypothetical protein
MTSAADPDTHTPFKLFRDLVDLVGIEPTTSSMPWKRAPSCATGPLFEGDTTGCPLRTALSILAEWKQIVNAPDENWASGKTGFPSSRAESVREMGHPPWRLLRGQKAKDLAHHAVGLIGLE